MRLIITIIILLTYLHSESGILKIEWPKVNLQQQKPSLPYPNILTKRIKDTKLPVYIPSQFAYDKNMVVVADENFYTISFILKGATVMVSGDRTFQEDFSKDLLGKGENPTRGVYVFYSNNKAFISVDKSSHYFNEHRGITAVDYSDKNNPHITAYQPDQVARKNTMFLSEEKNILIFLNNPYSLAFIVTVDANTLDIIDTNPGRGNATLDYFKEDGLNLFYTVRLWAEQPIYQFYYIDNNGMISNVALLSNNGSDYNFLTKGGRIGQNKYYQIYRIRNWDRGGKWESHKKIYDISNLPEVVLLDTIIFNVQP